MGRSQKCVLQVLGRIARGGGRMEWSSQGPQVLATLEHQMGVEHMARGPTGIGEVCWRESALAQ